MQLQLQQEIVLQQAIIAEKFLVGFFKSHYHLEGHPLQVSHRQDWG